MATTPGTGEPKPGDRVRDRFEALARERPKPPRLRNIVWIVVGGSALLAAIGQVTGIVSSPVAERVKEHMQAKNATATSRSEAGAAMDEDAKASSDARAARFPEGLPSEYESVLRLSVEAATRPEAPLAKAALSALPARAAEAPEARRCEVRAYVLRAAIAPAATERSPKRAVALRAAAEVLRADPACGPDVARRVREFGAVPALVDAGSDEETLLAAVLLASTATGDERPAVVSSLSTLVQDGGRPLAARVAAAKALEPSEIDDALRRVASEPGIDASLKAAIERR